MENYEYNNLIINNKLDKLANISRINDLVEYKYLNLYLIEYLLKNNIHTTIMDNRTTHSSTWIKFYLKYNILKPLLKCYLRPLLEVENGKTILDILFSKLDNNDRLELLNNLKNNSYWEFRDHEKEIMNLCKKHNTNFSRLFIDTTNIRDNISFKKSDTKLIDEFCEVFKDTDVHTLNVYLNEFKRRLAFDAPRAKEDIKKLINHKKSNKNFILKISNNTEGEYDGNLDYITISPKRKGVLTHELSHMMFQEFDEDNLDNILKRYEKIRKTIDKNDVILKITSYLRNFHERFNDMKKYFENIYYHEIKKKYGSYNEYVKTICNDIYKSNPDIISTSDDRLYFYVDEDNILDVVTELLIIEKNEFVNNNTRNYYSEELMLENLLDAVLKGAIFDGKLDVECFSGHVGKDFLEYDDLSFDECLADYDTIKNSKKGEKLINDLESLVGNKLIKFLDNYLIKNRGISHGM